MSILFATNLTISGQLTGGKNGLMASDMCAACLSLFALPLGVIGRLSSVIVALPGHFFPTFIPLDKMFF